MASSADFAAAQERIAARRRRRDDALAARTARERERFASSRISRMPDPLPSLWTTFRLQWSGIRGREGTKPAFRVGQVDAELLDEELLELLKSQVGEGLKYFGLHLRDEWAAEIMLALRAILFKLSIWDHDASYGASLQNLCYTDARDTTAAHAPPRGWQKALYGLFTVGGRYAWTKWEDYLLDVESGYDEPTPRVRKLSRITQYLSTAHSVAAFASFLVFLLNGKYRTVLDRILRLRLTPTTAQVSREVSFEYLNRQLVWHAFTEFLLFLLPLVGISRWRRWLSRFWRRLRSLLSSAAPDDDTPQGELGFLPERTCAICYRDQNPTALSEADVVALSGASSGVVGSAATDITNPYAALPCGCVYCYACLAGRLDAEEGDGWPCLRCGELVRECAPWAGDVLEEVRLPRRASTAKSVTFVDSQLPREEGAFETLEPRPVEDHREAAVEREIERRASAEAALGESQAWADLSRVADEASLGESREFVALDDELNDADAEAAGME